jgi:probable lipoprotein NlpC
MRLYQPFIALLFISFSFACSAQTSSSLSIDTIGIHAYFEKHTINLDKVENINLYYAIYKWRNTPYVLGGNSEKGIDCSNLVKRIYEDAYQSNLDGNVNSLFPKCNVLAAKDMAAEGDLVFFKINKNTPSHVAIYLQHGVFAHATVHGGVMLNNVEDNYYARYFYQAARPTADIFFSEK